MFFHFDEKKNQGLKLDKKYYLFDVINTVAELYMAVAIITAEYMHTE